MSFAEIQSALTEAKSIMRDSKAKIQEVLLAAELCKGVDLENANIKEEYDEMLNEIILRLNDALNEIGNC